MRYKIEYVSTTENHTHAPGDRDRWQPCAGLRWFLLSDRGTRLAKSDKAYKSYGAARRALLNFLDKVKGGTLCLSVNCLKELAESI